jgi:shikimate kinase
MIIFLIGFMGSGKSTLGKRLAKKIGYEFFDMDHSIEEQQGLTVAEIFEQKGEPFFRALETGFIESLASDRDLVIATGGGVPCFGQNMNLMNQKGVTVYLKLSPASLVGRLENARNVRPLIASIPKERLIEYIENKLPERERYYNQARCIIKGENVKPDHVVSLVFGKE